MGIESFIKKVAAQTAVYWGNPVSDGFGKYTFDDPIELKPPNGVRWDGKTSMVRKNDGEQETSDAEILVTRDLDLNGYIYLGTLASLTTAQKADPMIIPEARQIVKFEKVPMIKSTTVFVRKIYVSVRGQY